MYDPTVVHVLLVGHSLRRTPLYSLAAGKRLQFFVLKESAQGWLKRKLRTLTGRFSILPRPS